MGALFSVPMLSFLLIPTMSSYSTSLNLLFFYLTWTTLVLSHPPLRVELVGIAAVRLIFFLLPSLLFFLFDTAIPSAAAVIKVQGEDGLPGGRKKKVGRKQIKVAAWAGFNVVLGIVVQGLIEHLLTRVLGVKSALRVSTKLPLPLGIVKDLARGFLVREVRPFSILSFSIYPLLTVSYDTVDSPLHPPPHGPPSLQTNISFLPPQIMAPHPAHPLPLNSTLRPSHPLPHPPLPPHVPTRRALPLPPPHLPPFSRPDKSRRDVRVRGVQDAAGADGRDDDGRGRGQKG